MGIPDPDSTADPDRTPPMAQMQRGRINIALLVTAAISIAGVLLLLALWLNPLNQVARISPGEPGTAASADLSGDSMLRLVGSNTIGSRLGPSLAKSYLEHRLGATGVTIESDLLLHRHRVEGLLPGEKVRRHIDVYAPGSGFAFEALSRGDADIGLSSRPITPDEQNNLAPLGPMRDRKCEHIVGLDGIAIIVHPDNPVETLTVDQIRRIFAGSIRRWSEIGGPNEPIRRYSRNRESGTYPSFLELVGLTGTALESNTTYIVESQELSDTVANDRAAIGFVALPYIGRAKALKLSGPKGTSFAATPLNVYREYYPLSRRLYFYTPERPANPLVHDFLNFAASPAGQTIVEDNGFVGRKIDPVPGSYAMSWVSGDAPPRYIELTARAEAAPFTIRFKPGSAEPDNKAWDDLPRLMQLLISPQYRNREVVLASFGDHGAGRSPDTLPDAIATLKAELEKRGVKNIRIEDFGPSLPIASDETEDGKELNRRVELWLKH